MTLHSRTRVRHSVRPLNVFSFCGEPITASRDEYHLLTKDLPPCPKCKRVRDKAARARGPKSRRLV